MCCELEIERRASLRGVPVAGQQEAQEADDRGNNGASSSQEHVRTIAALQRMQASQANDSALDISRPKLRDNRQASIPACTFNQSQMLPRTQFATSGTLPSRFVTHCCSGLLSQYACFCIKPDVPITAIPSHVRVDGWGPAFAMCITESMRAQKTEA